MDHAVLGQAVVDQRLVDREFHAIITDLVGTPTELVTPEGRQVVWTAPQSTIWGGTVEDDWPQRVSCPIRCPGQYADPETGLRCNHHRYYDPQTGRYTTPDPIVLAPAPEHNFVPKPTTWIAPLGLAPHPVDSGALRSESALKIRYSAKTSDGRSRTGKPGIARCQMAGPDTMSKLIRHEHLALWLVAGWFVSGIQIPAE